MAGQGTGAIVTKALIGLNVAIYLVQIAQANDVRGVGGPIFENGVLYGPLVADGEWWRLVTAGFLHASPIHLLFNMLMLWWFGAALETLLGRGRFIAIYFVSILAGSAGALLVAPDEPVVGRLRRRLRDPRRRARPRAEPRSRSSAAARSSSSGSTSLLSFVLSYVSLGGHLGGLAGGMAAILVLTQFGRRHAVYGRADALTIAGLVGIAVISVAISYARVRGYA